MTMRTGYKESGSCALVRTLMEWLILLIVSSDKKKIEEWRKLKNTTKANTPSYLESVPF